MSTKSGRFSSLSIPLDRDSFLRELLRELAGVLEDLVGLEQAAGFISVVGQRIGDALKERYCAALGIERLRPEHLPEVLVDLKRRIKGDFHVINADTSKVVLGNRVCPFEENVIGHPCLCMMTSNVFGTIAAETVGYAKVSLERTIAEGHGLCQVVVYLQMNAEAEQAEGREYFRVGTREQE